MQPAERDAKLVSVNPKPTPKKVQLEVRIDASISHLLHRAQQIAADHHQASFGKTGLTQRQLAVLLALAEQDGISQTDLVLKTGVDRSTLAEMIARMEVKGLVSREKSSTDSRANTVRLTQLGNDMVLVSAPKLAEIDARILTLLPANQRSAFVELLNKIVEPNKTSERTAKIKANKKDKKKDKKKKDKKKRPPKN